MFPMERISVLISWIPNISKGCREDAGMFEGCRTVRSKDHGACGPDQSALFKSIIFIKFKAILV